MDKTPRTKRKKEPGLVGSIQDLADAIRTPAAPESESPLVAVAPADPLAGLTERERWKRARGIALGDIRP